MNRTWVVLLALLALPPIGHGQEVVRKWQAQAALEVDAAGQVAKATLLQDVPEAVAKPARDVMAHWRFKPVMRNGHAVSAKTYAFVELQLVKRDQAQFGLKVVYDANGPRLRPTVFPFPSGIGASSTGALLIEAVVQPDGHLDQVQVVETHFGSQNHLFGQSTTQAVRQWLADPEYVDGRPIATRVQIPFTVCGTGPHCGGPKLTLWHRPTMQDIPAPPATGQSVALDSPLEPLSVQSGG